MDWLDAIDLCERAHRACEAATAIQQTLEATCAETAAIVAQARQIRLVGPCIGEAPLARHASVKQPGEQETALEILHIMRTLLDGFPPHMQVKIVKALTAQTMVVVATQLDLPNLAISA